MEGQKRGVQEKGIRLGRVGKAFEEVGIGKRVVAGKGGIGTTGHEVEREPVVVEKKEAVEVG